MTALHLAGRRFPAVGLICPSEGETFCGFDYGSGPHEGERERSRYQRTLGDDRSGWYVPCENGLLVSVSDGFYPSTERWALEIDLVSRHCRLVEDGCGCSMWLPVGLVICDGRLVPEQPTRSGRIGYWGDADPEWAVELIDRVSVMPIDEPDGPTVELIGVDELRAMAETNR